MSNFLPYPKFKAFDSDGDPLTGGLLYTYEPGTNTPKATYTTNAMSVANANPAEKADLLSASISVAMNTTAFGLMVAIPLLVVHAILTSKTGDIVDSLEMATVKALNVFSRRAKRMAAAEA